MLGVHLRRGAQDDGIRFLELERIGQLGAHVRDAVLSGHLPGFFQVAADERNDFDLIDFGDGVQVLEAECAGTGEGDFEGHGWGFLQAGSRTKWPTAVLLAGT